MMDLDINEITAASGGRLVLRGAGTGDACVSSLVIDSRQVTEGGVFVATTGERVDGHRFIASVFEKGAALAITQKTPEQVEAETGVGSGGWGSYLLVEDTLQALKDIAEYYRRKFSIPVVGITGSVGKTSTKEFVAGVLAEKYNVLKTDGNYNNEIGVPLTLFRLRREHTAAVVEMGISDFGEMHRLSKMARPDICVITNIGQCHLENLKTRDGILKAKSEIFDYMAEDGQVCLNGGDDKLSALMEIKGRKPHFFGWGDNPAEEVSAGEVVSHGLWGSDAVLTLRGRVEGAEEVSVPERIAVQVPLPGRPMVLNSAAAACVAGLMGLSPEQIAAGISRVRPVDGRNHLLRLKDYTLIDDCYNANPASMKAAIDLLAMADGPKAAILGDMFELGENSHAMHREIGAYAAAAGIDRIYCVGEEAEFMYQAAQKDTLEPSGSQPAQKDTLEPSGSQPAQKDTPEPSGSQPVQKDTPEPSGSQPAQKDTPEPSGSQPAQKDTPESSGSQPVQRDLQSAATVQAAYFSTKEELLRALAEDPAKYIPGGSTVLVKASHGMAFEQIVEFFKGL